MYFSSFVYNIFIWLCWAQNWSCIFIIRLSYSQPEYNFEPLWAHQRMVFLWWADSCHLPCGHLLGRGLPLGSFLWCITVSLSLSHWYPRSGVVLNCILPYFDLLTGLLVAPVGRVMKRLICIHILHQHQFKQILYAKVKYYSPRETCTQG